MMHFKRSDIHHGGTEGTKKFYGKNSSPSVPLRSILSLSPRGDAPDFAAAIIRNQEGTVWRHSYTHWTAIRFEFGLVGDEAGQNVLDGPGGFPVGKGDEGDLKADHLRAIPRPVHADERAALIAFGKCFAVVKRKTQRRDMGS